MFVAIQAFTGKVKPEGVFSIFSLTPGGGPKISSSEIIPPKVPVEVSTSQSAENNNTGSSNTNLPVITPPAGFTLSQLSPYYGKVHLQSANGSPYSNMLSTFSVYADYGNKEPIDVTGWSLKGNFDDVLIPQAVSDYSPYSVYTPGDIMLAPGDDVYGYGTQSAVGQNFRLNKCIGYINNSNSFNPPLPYSCPSDVNKLAISGFPGDCQSFIYSVAGSCKVPSADALNQFTGPNYISCRDYLNRFNYTTCYQTHRADVDFFSHEWRVWLGRSFNFDNQHDNILLYDKNGLLVDQRIY